MSTPENIQKHATLIDKQLDSLLISTLRNSLVQASAEIEELKAKVVELTPKPEDQKPETPK